jgi:hypothetical protein
MRARPLGITILAILHLVGGAVLCAVTVPLLSKLGTLQGVLRSAGSSVVLLAVSAIFLGALGFSAGVGMWLGKKWGWWLGAFYYVYGVARNASALITVIEMSNELGRGAHGPGFYLMKQAVRIIVHLFILNYLFKTNVLSYFELERLSRGKALSILVSICLAIGMVAGVSSMFSQ